MDLTSWYPWQPLEIFVDDETKLTLHGLQQHYVKLEEAGKNRKLKDFQDTQIYSGSPLSKPKQTTINDQKDDEYSSPRYSRDLAKDCSLVSTEKQKKQVEKIVAVEEHSKKEISSKAMHTKSMLNQY